MQNNMMKKFSLAAAAVAAVLLTGCSSVALDDSAKNGTTLGDIASQQTTTAGEQVDINAGKSVYFDFDSYTVKAEGMAVVEANARKLMADPKAQATIEGNTDSRGSREYNLALGQKRSEAVKQRLQLLGIASSRIEAVSFGREKPAALGDNEAAWSQNRRADIVIQPSAQ